MSNVSKNDFLFFQNDILKDIKRLESTLNNKIVQINQNLATKINSHDTTITRLSGNINELLSINASRNHDNQRIEELLKMRTTMNDNFIDFKTQINLINKTLSSAISKYDRIIIDNLSLPGIVGMNCKYKNVKEFLEFVFSDLKANKLFKEEQILNSKKYKEQLDNLIKKEEAELIKVTNKTTNICNTKFEKYEKILEDKFNSTLEVVENIRLENSKYAASLIEKTKDLTIEKEKLNSIKKEIFDEFEEELKKFRKEVLNNTKVFLSNQNEFKILKQRFTQLSEFIKDARFKKNIKQDDFFRMSKNIDFSKKQKYNDDYNMELYNEITKDIMNYLNNGKEEKKSPRRRNTQSIIFNNSNRENLKNTILENIIKSEKKPEKSSNISNLKWNKLSPVSKKRNSITFQQNEFFKMKNKIYGYEKTPIKEEELQSRKKSVNISLKFNTIIENEKNKNSSSSSSSSSTLKSLKSSHSSKGIKYIKKVNSSSSLKEKDNKEKKKEENKNIIKENIKSNKEDKKEIEDYNKIKNNISNNNSNKKTINKKLTKTESQIKAIKEEYGYIAKLMSVDFMASNQDRQRVPNDPKFQALNLYNNILEMSGKQNLAFKTTPNLKFKRFHSNYINDKSNFNNNTNLIFNNIQMSKNNSLYFDSNKLKNQDNKNILLPNISLNSDRSKDKILLLRNTFNVNIYKNNKLLTEINDKTPNKKDKFLYNIENSNKSILNYSSIDKNLSNIKFHKNKSLPRKISMKLGENLNSNEKKRLNNEKINTIESYNNKNLNIENNLNNIKNDKKINNENNIEVKNNNINIKNQKYFSTALIVQNIEKFNILRNKNKENILMNTIKDNIKIENNSKNKEKNIQENKDNNNDMVNIERELEKEQNEITFNIIKDRIDKINISNEALSSRINTLEDKYIPVIGQIGEMFKIITLIYEQIKKEKIEQSITVIQNNSNNNKSEIHRSKISNNLKKNILKEYKTKKGINLIYPFKYQNSNNINNSKNKQTIKEENNYYNEISDDFNTIMPKDDINCLLRKIEPFLIKEFSK